MPEGIKYAKDFQIPAEFPEVLRNLTREILRDQPKDINKYGMCTLFEVFAQYKLGDRVASSNFFSLFLLLFSHSPRIF